MMKGDNVMSDRKVVLEHEAYKNKEKRLLMWIFGRKTLI